MTQHNLPTSLAISCIGGYVLGKKEVDYGSKNRTTLDEEWIVDRSRLKELWFKQIIDNYIYPIINLEWPNNRHKPIRGDFNCLETFHNL